MEFYCLPSSTLSYILQIRQSVSTMKFLAWTATLSNVLTPGQTLTMNHEYIFGCEEIYVTVIHGYKWYVGLLSGVPDFFDRNKISSGGDLSHYQVPHCIRVFFYFVWFVFIHHNFQFYFELCTYCDILDIYLS